VKDSWVRSMVQHRDDVVLIDAAILGPPAVFEASGHLENFSDPLVDCTVCKRRFREDQLEDRDCPQSRKGCAFTEARAFNLMFKTHAGPVEGSGTEVYLRPETAQGMFVNFANVLQTSRRRPPFGIAQVGKSFRNEITPGNFIFRTREFEQMEMEYFVPPADSARWFEYWCDERMRWYADLGIPSDMLRLRHHDADELSHYSAGTADIEFRFPWGWGELEGIAQRTDFDLGRHAERSGQRLDYFDQATNERYVLPLSKKDELSGVARRVFSSLADRWMCDYDETQAIGRRYRRQDEIGTPLCVTVDFDSLEDHSVTVRDRDTTAQTRVPIDRLADEVGARLGF
jgi:glycyl-tRNA synthetase